MNDVIETPRLMLRHWREEDLEPFVEIFAMPEVMYWSTFRRGLTRDEAVDLFGRIRAHWDEHGLGMRAVTLKQENRLIGYIGHGVPVWLPEVLPAVEIGYRLHPAYWKRGLATEGGAACLDHGFSALGLLEMIAIYEPGNVASGRVMEKLGMRPARETTDPENGNPLHVYAITRDEWVTRG